MTDHYDVIIIGSGAGGGTLAHTLANSGKRILLLERGDFLPREMDNWNPEPVFIDGKYISKDTWYDADGKPFQPQVHYYVGGATKLYGAALYRLRPAGLRRAAPRRRRLAGVAADLRRLRAVVHEGRVAVPGARQRRRGPDRGSPRRSRTRGRRCRTSRASSSSSDELDGGRLPPVPRAVRHPARRGRPGPEHLHPLHVVRRLPVPGARQVRRRDDRRAPAARPAQRHAARRRRGDQARDRRRRAHGHRRRRVPRRRASEVYAADIVVVSAGAVELGQAAAALGQRPASRTAWPTARTRSAGTTCSTTARRSSRWPRSPTTRSSRRRSGINDFYFGAPGYDWPAGNIQMVGKSNAEAMKGEEPKLTKLAPHWSASPTSPTTPSTSG